MWVFPNPDYFVTTHAVLATSIGSILCIPTPPPPLPLACQCKTTVLDVLISQLYPNVGIFPNPDYLVATIEYWRPALTVYYVPPKPPPPPRPLPLAFQGKTTTVLDVLISQLYTNVGISRSGLFGGDHRVLATSFDSIYASPPPPLYP